MVANMGILIIGFEIPEFILNFQCRLRWKQIIHKTQYRNSMSFSIAIYTFMK
jgi:hypothetical protein